MLLKDFIKNLQKLEREGHGNKVVIYSSDDEGNDYHNIYNTPTLIQIEDEEAHSIELILPEKGKVTEQYLKDCNAVIIN